MLRGRRAKVKRRGVNLAGVSVTNQRNLPIFFGIHGGAPGKGIGEGAHRQLKQFVTMMSALPSTALLARISFDQAVEAAVRILDACGLTATHGIAAIYGDGDFRAEGAAFAVTIHPKAAAGETERRPVGPDRGSLKLLIQNDGQTSLRALPKRRPRREASHKRAAQVPAAAARQF